MMDTLQRIPVAAQPIWSDIYPGYGSLHPVDKKRIDFIVQEVVNHFGMEKLKDLALLDCGCGNGTFSGHLSKAGLRVLGIDLNRKALKSAERNFGSTGKCAYVCSNVYDIDNLVRDNTFDVIVCSEILEHIHKPDILLAALRKKLKVDGLMICCVPNGCGPSETGQALMTAVRWWPQTVFRSIIGLAGLWGPLQCRRNREVYPEGGHVKYYSLEQWFKLFVESGMRPRRYACSIGMVGFSPLTLKLRSKSLKSCHTIDTADPARACGYFIACTK